MITMEPTNAYKRTELTMQGNLYSNQGETFLSWTSRDHSESKLIKRQPLERNRYNAETKTGIRFKIRFVPLQSLYDNPYANTTEAPTKQIGLFHERIREIYSIILFEPEWSRTRFKIVLFLIYDAPTNIIA